MTKEDADPFPHELGFQQGESDNKHNEYINSIVC